MKTTDMPLDDIAALLGGPVEPVVPDPDELAILLAVQRIRGLLLEAAQRDGVGVNQLASRLKVSPSAVSRVLRSEGDMRVSTAVLFALALGRQWAFTLSSKGADKASAEAGRSTRVQCLVNPEPTEATGKTSFGARVTRLDDDRRCDLPRLAA